MTSGLEDPQGLLSLGKTTWKVLSELPKDCLVLGAVKESLDIGSVSPKSKSSNTSSGGGGGGRMNERARRFLAC